MPSSIILLATTSGSSKKTQTYYVKYEEFRINKLDAGYSFAEWATTPGLQTGCKCPSMTKVLHVNPSVFALSFQARKPVVPVRLLGKA